MKRHATEEEAVQIHALLSRVVITGENKVQCEGNDGALVTSWARTFGYKRKTNCDTCWLYAVDVIRGAVGLGPARRPASENLITRRLNECHTCPAHHIATGSCGRLLLDAVAPNPVTDVDGSTFNPCGCLVELKARVRSESCPADRWPHR